MTDNLTLRTIFLRFEDERTKFHTFLQRHGLQPETDLTYAVALTDEQGRILACGGTNGRFLKCFAVEPELRGQNALGRLLQPLLQHCMETGCYNPLVATRPHNVPLFEACGFFLIARTDTVGLLERSPNGLRRFTAALRPQDAPDGSIGAIVLNANPFTLGHRHLIRTAAAQCARLYLFVVEEDRSVVPFADRLQLVRAGTQDLTNVIVCGGGPYIISGATFPRYFLKTDDEAAAAQTQLDATVFAQRIAPALGIDRRFVGSEPGCALTRRYNQTLQEILPQHGIALQELPRLACDDEPISASRVRSLLAAGTEPAQLTALLPPTTIAWLDTPAGQAVLQTLKSTTPEAKDV